MSRKDARIELSVLLQATLSDLVSKKPDSNIPAVYSGQVGDFQKARAAVVISSASTTPYPLAFKRLVGNHDIAVDIFVLYADPDANWDEEMAEDLLDDISESLMNTLAINPVGENWTALKWNEKSQTSSAEIGGVEYRRETIILQVT